MILYKVTVYGDPKIEEKEVAGRTAKQVVLIGGRREAIESEWYFWSEEREIAKAWLLDRITQEITRAEGSASYYRGKLEQVKNL